MQSICCQGFELYLNRHVVIGNIIDELMFARLMIGTRVITNVLTTPYKDQFVVVFFLFAFLSVRIFIIDALLFHHIMNCVFHGSRELICSNHGWTLSKEFLLNKDFLFFWHILNHHVNIKMARKWIDSLFLSSYQPINQWIHYLCMERLIDVLSLGWFQFTYWFIITHSILEILFWEKKLFYRG